jgi:CheY-like chemotaxis protein/HPt (histidine-containing phosphotransfer) domain-containing protein
MVGDITVKSVYGQGSVFTATVLQLIRGMVPCALVERPETKNVLVYETRPVYARSLTYTIDNLGVGCALVHNENDFLERLDSVDWQFVITSSALCDEVETILKERHAKARLVLFTAFGETSRPGTTSLPAPALPWTVADILNGETGAALSPETQKTAPRCTAPEARILIVDDIATNLEVASGLLAPWQMTIDRALGGLEAINLVEKNHVSGGKGYDLILMDHMMPGMDGVETTARIRAWEQETAQSPVPVIALTANAVSGMKEMFLEKGFSDFISKPIDPAKLEEKIAQWLPARKKVKGKGAGEIESGTLKMEGKEEGGILIPGVDTAKGIAMTGGTAAGCKKVLSLFRKDARERLALLQDPPEPEALPVFVTQVHALKSASATIGAAEVSAEAAAMEAAGKGALAGNATDTAAIREKLPGFYRRLSALIEAIAKEEELTTKAQSNLRFAAQKEDTEKGRDNAAYGEHLALLKSALEAKDMKEIDRLLEEIEKMSLDAETREGIDVVSDKVLMGEYAGALETANTLFDNTAGKGTV